MDTGATKSQKRVIFLKVIPKVLDLIKSTKSGTLVPILATLDMHTAPFPDVASHILPQVQFHHHLDNALPEGWERA